MKAPQAARHSAIAEAFALTPPNVPEPAQIIIGGGLLAGEFIGQQAGDAEQPRLQRQRVECAVWRANTRAQFGQSLHGPNVVFVAQSPHGAIPEGLLPSRLARAGLQLDGLAAQANK